MCFVSLWPHDWMCHHPIFPGLPSAQPSFHSPSAAASELTKCHASLIGNGRPTASILRRCLAARRPCARLRGQAAVSYHDCAS